MHWESLSDPFFLVVFFCNFFSGLAMVLIGAFALVQASRKWQSRRFFIMMLMGGMNNAMTGVMNMITYLTGQFEPFSVFLYQFFGVFFPSTLLWFAITFPRYPKRWKPRYTALLFLPALIFLGVAITNGFYSSYEIINRRLIFALTPWYLVYVAFSIFVFLACGVMVVWKSLTETHPLYRKQIRLIALGGMISGAAILVDLVAMYAGLRTYTYQFGILLFAFTVMQAITRYEAFDIRTAIQYTLIWIGSRVFLMVPIIIAPIYIAHFNRVVLISWGFAVIGYQTILQKTVYIWIDRFTYRQKTKFSVSADQFLHKLNRLGSQAEIEKLTWQYLNDNIHVRDSLLLISPVPGVISGRFNRAETAVHIPLEISDWLLTAPAIITKTLLCDSGTIGKSLLEMGIQLIVPLRIDDSDHGYLCLTENTRLKPFRKEEIDFAVIISRMLALYLKNQKEEQRGLDISNDIIHQTKNCLENWHELCRNLNDPAIEPEEINQLIELQTADIQHTLSACYKHLEIERLKQSDLVKCPVLLQDVISLAIASNQQKCQKQQIKILQIGDASVWIQADSHLLATAFSNLIDNALKYLNNQRPIELRLSNTDNKIEIRIRDYGPGINPETQARLFYHGKLKWVRDGRGKYASFGFGLPYCFNIIHKHGGTIRLNNVFTEGTEWEIVLPTKNSGFRQQI